jgi:hypothetical protein
LIARNAGSTNGAIRSLSPVHCLVHLFPGCPHQPTKESNK